MDRRRIERLETIAKTMDRSKGGMIIVSYEDSKIAFQVGGKTFVRGCMNTDQAWELYCRFLEDWKPETVVIDDIDDMPWSDPVFQRVFGLKDEVLDYV